MRSSQTPIYNRQAPIFKANHFNGLDSLNRLPVKSNVNLQQSKAENEEQIR